MIDNIEFNSCQRIGWYDEKGREVSDAFFAALAEIDSSIYSANKTLAAFESNLRTVRAISKLAEPKF